MTPKRSPHVLPFLPGVSQLLPSFGVLFQVLVRKTPKAALKESPSLGIPWNNYPKESWTHWYTDGSVENAVRNGGAGVHIQYAGGKEDKIGLATGLYSTNYKGEAEALKTAAAHIEVSTHASPNVVLLTDTLSVLQALQSNRDTELNNQSATLASLCRGHAVTLQWIPTKCSYPEVKTILKAKQHSKWRHKHPRYKADPYYLLTRREQVTVFRPQPPQLSPIFQTPHWPYRAVPLWYWQSDKRTSTAFLPHLRATQKGNLARPHSHSLQALWKPEGPAMHCHLHWGDWSFHLMNEKKNNNNCFSLCLSFSEIYYLKLISVY